MISNLTKTMKYVLANVVKKRSLSCIKTVLLLCVCCPCIMIFLSCQTGQRECNKPFNYSFLDKTVSFPLSVDEAVTKYNLIKNKYDVLHDSNKTNEANISIYYIGGFEDPRYNPRTNFATQQYYNKDIYAVNFHLRDQTMSMNRIIEKLQKDFKKKFIKKRTRMDRIGIYYEIIINDCVKVIVYNAPIFNSTFGPGTVNILFTYKLVPVENSLFLETNGSIRGD